MSLLRSAKLAGFVLVTAALCACPKNDPGSPDGSQVQDSGPNITGADGGNSGDGGDGDSGVPDAGPVTCRIDDDCAVLKQGLRCDDATHLCIAARECSNDDGQCDSQQPDDYCYHYGTQCRCVTEPHDGGTESGVCRRRRGSCDECTDSSQCGSNTQLFDPPGQCKPLQGDPSGKSYCLLQKQGSSCPCGMVDDGTGFCKPQSNSCSAVGCEDDKGCPSGAVCDKARCLCVSRCRWDFAAGAEATPGCPPGQICWVDNDSLDPASVFYGSGRCHPPCSSDTDCTNTATDPYGGANLVCKAEKLKGGGDSAKRCRAKGECMDNLECPELPADSVYLGYCDRGAFACKTDCRVGTDPQTTKPYADCKVGYKCEAQNGQNVCVQLSCAEQGGARLACNRGEYCCGEDKDGDGKVDPCPPAAEQQPNGCYTAPKPPFCTTCMSNDDCNANLTLPAWLQGACTNGSKSPNCSVLPNVCISAGKRPDGSEGVNICAPSTYDDKTRNAAGVPKDAQGCPAGYATQAILPKFVDGDNYCATNTDCGPGGICDADTTQNLPDGGHPLACLCTKPGMKDGCPNDADAGTSSICRNGLATPSVCIFSVTCYPPNNVVYLDAGSPYFGCGL